MAKTKQYWTSTWRERVRARASYITAQADNAQKIQRIPDNDPLLSRLHQCINESFEATKEPKSLMGRIYFHSAELERAWASLHTAEVLLLQVMPEDDLASRKNDVLARARHHLAPDDPRLVDLDGSRTITHQAGMSKLDRNVLVGILDATYQVEDSELARVRSLRNTLWATTFFVCIGIIGFTIWMWLHPAALSLCFRPGNGIIACPSGEYLTPKGSSLTTSSAAAPQDIIAVEIAGLAGAALTVIASLRRIPGTSTPYALSLAAAVLKFPTGALAGVLGILLIHGGFVPGLSNLDSRAQVLAWAVAFGVAQHLITRLVDQRAQRTLSEAGKAGDPDDVLFYSRSAGSLYNATARQ